jgi:hypothetical protein
MKAEANANAGILHFVQDDDVKGVGLFRRGGRRR